jgi:hypothetical protein
MRRLRVVCLSAAAVSVWAVHPASAALIQINSNALFAANSIGDTVITFEATDTSGSTGYTSLGKSLVLSGVTFTDATNMYAVTSGFGAVNNNGNTHLAFDGSNNGVATPPAGKTAVGFDLYGDGTTPAVVEIDTSDGNQTLVTETPAAPDVSPAEFLGFTETAPGITITRIVYDQTKLATGNQTPAIDNFTFGTAVTQTPEPAAIALVCAGTALVRRRHRV